MDDVDIDGDDSLGALLSIVGDDVTLVENLESSSVDGYIFVRKISGFGDNEGHGTKKRKVSQSESLQRDGVNKVYQMKVSKTEIIVPVT